MVYGVIALSKYASIMRVFPFFFLLLCGIVLSIVLPGCDPKGSEKDSFDRTAMLTHYADRVIVPAYAAFKVKAAELEVAVAALVTSPDATKLTTAQNAWLQAALTFQTVNGFNFGPAGEEGTRKSLAEELGTWPANTQKIEDFIVANDNSLTNFNRDTRGLFSIEYLLFSETGDQAALVLALQNANRSRYLTAVTRHLNTQINRVVDEWGVYRSFFLAANGTDAGSSTSVLYNEFVKSFEGAKNFKVALPLGKRAGQTQQEPRLVEARYSGVSMQLLKAHLKSIYDVYSGVGSGGVDGVGLKDYLNAVEGGSNLVGSSDAQWKVVSDLLNRLPNTPPMQQLITNGNQDLLNLQIELQKQTRFFKSDMSSLLGIAITYTSGDGD